MSLIQLPTWLSSIPPAILDVFVCNLLPVDEDIAWGDQITSLVREKLKEYQDDKMCSFFGKVLSHIVSSCTFIFVPFSHFTNFAWALRSRLNWYWAEIYGWILSSVREPQPLTRNRFPYFRFRRCYSTNKWRFTTNTIYVYCWKNATMRASEASIHSLPIHQLPAFFVTK